MLPDKVELADIRTIYQAVTGQKHWRERSVLTSAHNLVGYGLGQLAIEDAQAIGDELNTADGIFGYEPLYRSSGEPLTELTDEQASQILAASVADNPEAIGGPLALLGGLVAKQLALWLLKKLAEKLLDK